MYQGAYAKKSNQRPIFNLNFRLEGPIKKEKCDKSNESQLWNFHLLNQ